jgi:hypothetical protein
MMIRYFPIDLTCPHRAHVSHDCDGDGDVLVVRCGPVPDDSAGHGTADDVYST